MFLCGLRKRAAFFSFIPTEPKGNAKMWNVLITLLGAMMILILTMVPAAAENYEVIVPEGYEEGTYRYPVIYVMPEDEGVSEALTDAMNRGDGMSMILVHMKLEPEKDPAAAAAEVVEQVDREYRTVADPAHRAAVGTGTGGYLAWSLTLGENAPFGAAASIRGRFTEEDNPWYGSFGSLMEKMESLHRANANVFDGYYTYLDAPVEDAWTDLPGGTDDLGALMIDYGTGSAFHEFTVRPGGYDEAFLKESASRVMDRLTGYMLGDLIQGSLEPEKTVVGGDEPELAGKYSLKTGAGIKDFTEGTLPAKVTISLADSGTGEILASETQELAMAGGEETEGSFRLSNNLGGNGAELRLSATLLGAERTLARTALARDEGTVLEGDRQEISLSGDWHFSYVGTQKQMDAAALHPEDFADWDIVQPGMGNWTKGFGNISDKNVRSGYGPDYFDFFIVGNGYYARTFTLPAEFDTLEPVLSIGYVDDRCEVFLNGTRVGGTGIDEKGTVLKDTTWAVFSHFEIDPKLLNRDGENTVVVRAYNDLPYGAGGWYGGPIGLYSKSAFEAKFMGDGGKRFYEETFSSALAASAQGKSGEVENQYLIYLPEEYAETNRDYPTVYLLHQFNSDHTSYRTDRIDQLLDEGIRKGLFDPMIVVIPNSAEESWWRGDWERMITEELIPLIDSKYRTIRDPRYRLTAGCSMGGQGAYGVALRNPDCFSGIISFFGAFSYGGTNSPNVIAEQESPEYLSYFTHYFVCGNQDSYRFGTPAIRLHQTLLKKDVAHGFLIENGGHDSAFYLPLFQEAFRYVRSGMYHSDAETEKQLHGSLMLEGTKLRAEVEAEEGISKYLLQIPESTYTRDSAPALSVPLRIEVTREGETVAVFTDREVRMDASNRSASLEADLTELMKTGEKLTIRLSASVFDRCVLLDTMEMDVE